MKKTYKLFSAAAILLSIIFTSCYDPIFYEIRKDVKPEEATVSGNINGIARYTTTNGKEYLVLAADNGLRYKEASNQSHGSWRSYGNLPFSAHSYDYYSNSHNGQQIVKVLADSSTLYIISAKYKDNANTGTVIVDYLSIYGKQMTAAADGSWEGGDWTKIVEDTSHTYFPFYYDSEGSQYSAFAAFSTNSPIAANRKVFLRRGENLLSESSALHTVTYSQLSGFSAPAAYTPAGTIIGEAKNLNSVVSLNGGLIFFEYLGCTTNETYTTPATRAYYGKGSELWYSDADNSTTFVKAFDAGVYILCIATCNDSIILGRGNYYTGASSSVGGAVKANLTNGVPGTGLVDFSTNAAFQLTTNYYVNTLLNATPDKNETDSALYASLSFVGSGSSTNVSYDNVGLWSYYPARGNWNRE